MKKSFIQKFGVLFLLVLVVFQQIGAGLYIHNQLHSGKEQRSHDQHHETSQEIKFACSCVDNFLAPVLATDEITINQPVCFHLTVPGTYLEEEYFTPFVLPTLRGPPVFIA